MEENKRIILGLDVSTTTIGIALMNAEDGRDPEVLKITHVSPKVSKNIKGIESLCLKKQIFETEFLNKYTTYGITDVVIEEPLLGSNNVNTVSVLLKFNGMISDCVYSTLGIVPSYISSYDSRKYAFPQLMGVRKRDRKGELYDEKKLKKSAPVLFGDYNFDIDKKLVIQGLISEKYPEIDWPMDENGEYKKQTFDCSDAICCVLGFLGLEKDPKPIKEKKSKKK